MVEFGIVSEEREIAKFLEKRLNELPFSCRLHHAIDWRGLPSEMSLMFFASTSKTPPNKSIAGRLGNYPIPVVALTDRPLKYPPSVLQGQLSMDAPPDIFERTIRRAIIRGPSVRPNASGENIQPQTLLGRKLNNSIRTASLHVQTGGSTKKLIKA